MWEFLFVYDRARRTYPVRFWIRSPGETLGDAPPDLERMDGWVDEAFADDLLAGLRLRFTDPSLVVERMSGTSWDAVETNFPGLHFH